ncbi:MAG: protein-S-isoprenylcysteine methyltransferase [Ignavibacteriae bacterium]|nr:MAG: protein-S-isoprenylcysteine methyltransferase [Ignavibacteriota bacterium]
MEYIQIVFLWSAYCALHSYLISTSFTTFLARSLKKSYAFYRAFYVLFSLALLILLIKYTGQFDSAIIITDGPALNIARKVLVAGSLGMFFWAFFFNYDSLSFFGIRQILNMGKPTNPSGDLKRDGLLGLMRHPMYLALIVYLWCQTYTLMDIVVNTVLSVYVIIGTILEEKKLVLEFGDTYVKYQQEVPMLVPFTKARSNS